MSGNWEESAGECGRPNATIDGLEAGDDLSSATGLLVTLGSDGKLYKYDPSTHASRMAAFCQNRPSPGGKSVLQLTGFVTGLAKGAIAASDRLAPATAGDIGKVKTWAAGNVTVGFAVRGSADGEPVLLYIHHEIAST
jgi:hypothetical protein